MLAFALALIAGTGVARADWTALGDTVNVGPTFQGQRPDVADVGGVPYVAWRDGPDDHGDIRVARWTGSAWQSVGSALNANSAASPPSITSVAGVPYVAFLESPAGDNTDSEVHVSRLNGTGDGWVTTGGGSLNHDPADGDAQEVSISTVGAVPYLAFTESDGTNLDLWVKTLQSGSWVAVGGKVDTLPVNAFAPDIAAVDGDPCVTWLSDGNSGEAGLRVSCFSGSSWAFVGGTVRGGLDGWGGHLTDVGGTPTVLLGRPVEGDRIAYAVRQWNGTSWADLGNPHPDPVDEVAYSDGSITTIGGAPYLALPLAATSDAGPFRIRVLTYNGTAWTQVGSDLHRTAAEYPYTPAISAIGDSPFVTWYEQPDDVAIWKIRAAQFEPSGSVQFSADEYEVDEDEGSIAITVERSSSSGPSSVHVQTSNGTAGSPADYTAGSGTVQFTDGQTEQALLVTINDDGLVEGDENFSITLSSPSGTTLGTPDTATITIKNDDKIDTEIFGGPSGFTNVASASFALTATPSAAASFECSLDNAPFAACTTPVNLAGLAQGAHQFRARAKNATDTDQSPASRNFFVDTVAPTSGVTLASGSGGTQLSGNSRYTGTVLATATANDPSPSSGVFDTRCALDPVSVPTQFFDMPLCTGPKSTSTPGIHTFYASSRDGAGSPGPVVSKTFTILPTPETTVTIGPSGETWLKTPFFAFESSIAGSTFQCRIDGAAFASCASPYTSRELSPGAHSFEVRATSPEGAPDPTPARRDFTVGGADASRKQCEIQPFMELDRRAGTFDDAPPDGCWIATDLSDRESFCGPPGGPPDDYKCVSTGKACPQWALCTVTVETSWFDADKDTNWTASASPYLNTGTSAFNYTSCTTGPDGDRCFVRASETSIRVSPDPFYGRFSGVCEAGAYSGVGKRGPDNIRRIECSVQLDVKSTSVLQAVASGSSVQVLVPGAGTVTVAPGGGRGRIARRSDARAAFGSKTITSTEAGLVTFKPKLSKRTKRKLKKKHKVTLKLRTSFEPAGGGEAVTGNSKVTLVKPTKKPPRVPPDLLP